MITPRDAVYSWLVTTYDVVSISPSPGYLIRNIVGRICWVVYLHADQCKITKDVRDNHAHTYKIIVVEYANPKFFEIVEKVLDGAKRTG